MVGRGVRVAKNGKSGEAKSLFIRQIQGKTAKVALYMWAKAECPRLFYTEALSLHIYSLHPGTGKNRD